MQWIDSSIFYGVVVEDGETTIIFHHHDNPYAAFEDIKRIQSGGTFIRNERGVSCWPYKALKYFDRRAKERGKNSAWAR